MVSVNNYGGKKMSLFLPLLALGRLSLLRLALTLRSRALCLAEPSLGVVSTRQGWRQLRYGCKCVRIAKG